MRGRYLPISFLLLAFVAGLWLLIGVFSQDREPEWRVAGLGSPAKAAASWPSMDWRIAVAALPAAAQDGQKTRQRRPSPLPPKFSRIVIRPGFNSSFEGTGQPGQRVDVMLDGKSVASIRVGDDGRWRAATGLLAAGDYRVSVVARVPDGDTVVVGQNVRIAIPEKTATSEIVAYSQSEAERAADLRLEAERLAEAASKEFDDFAKTQQVSEQQQQSQELESSKEAETPQQAGEDDGVATAFDQVEDWFNKSSEHYHRYVVPELARKGERPTATPSKDAPVPSPEPPGGEKVVSPSAPTVIQRAQDWFSEANQRYQDTIVRDLSLDQEPPVGASDAGQEIASEGTPSEEDAPQFVEGAPAVTDDEPRGQDVGQGEADQSKQEVAQERLRLDEAKRAEEAARQRQLGQLLARREAEFAQAEKERRAREAAQERARLAEEQRKAEAERQQRLAAEQAQREAEAKQAEAERRAREAAQERARLAEEQRKVEAERQKRLAEARQRREEEAELQRLKKEEARRKADEARQKVLVEERAKRQRERLIAEAQARAEKEWQAELDRPRQARLEKQRREEQQRRQTEIQEQQRRAEIAMKATRANHIDALADEAISPRGTSTKDAGQEDTWTAAESPTEESNSGWQKEEAERLVQGPRSERRGRSAGWRARGGRSGTGCRDRRAGRTVRLPGTYVVARGDTLWHISRRHYRRGYRYRRIYRANRRKIRNPHWIYPCQKFWLPRARRKR